MRTAKASTYVRSAPGDHVVLGGVNIAHDRGLVAHSDGDVVIHALCDAILGALALGDIGQHFPPSDPRWKDVGSRHFLLHCAGLIAEHITCWPTPT